MSLVIFTIIWTIISISIGSIIWRLISSYDFSKLLKGQTSSRTLTENSVPVLTNPPSSTPPPSLIPMPIRGLTAKKSPPVLVQGPDGKSSQFELYVFSQEFNWKKSLLVAQFNGKIINEIQMVSFLSEIHGDMKTRDALIYVGTASYDIEENRAGEEDRALMRALQLVIWGRMALKEAVMSPHLYALNLGHYTEPPDKNEQRLIVIIGVKKVDPLANIEALLAPEYSETLKAKLKEKKFQFDLDVYSKFELLKRS